MRREREWFSFSGIPSQLIALGGSKNIDSLSVCEKYLIAVNKWSGLPPLENPPFMSISVLLESRKAFIFCGYARRHLVETLETDTELRWKTLPVKIGGIGFSMITCVSFQGSIIVYGSSSFKKSVTFVFEEEGLLMKELGSMK